MDDLLLGQAREEALFQGAAFLTAAQRFRRDQLRPGHFGIWDCRMDHIRKQERAAAHVVRANLSCQPPIWSLSASFRNMTRDRHADQINTHIPGYVDLRLRHTQSLINGPGVNNTLEYTFADAIVVYQMREFSKKIIVYAYGLAIIEQVHHAQRRRDQILAKQRGMALEFFRK
jgi:hypothetical protein